MISAACIPFVTVIIICLISIELLMPINLQNFNLELWEETRAPESNLSKQGECQINYMQVLSMVDFKLRAARQDL